MLNISYFNLQKRQNTFDDLSVGDIFMFEDEPTYIYMVTENTGLTRDGYDYNAVCLNTGEIKEIDDLEAIIPLEGDLSVRRAD